MSLNNLNPFAIESLEAQSGCFTSSTFYRRKPAQLGLHCLPRGQYIPKRDERETRAAALMKFSIKNGVNTGWLVCYVCSIGMTGTFFFQNFLMGTDHELTSFFFPERRFVAGFFRRLLAYLTPHISHTYLTPHISHTYPSHHTYPAHIHSKRIHSKRIPPLHIPPIRICSTRIPPVRNRAMRIHSERLHQQVLQYVSHQYVSVQHVSHQYVSMLCVSIQCVSIQKVCISRNRKRIPPIHFPPIRIFNTYPTSTDPFNAYPFKKFASAGMAMSMSIIAYHFIPLLLGGNGNEYRNLAFPSISLQNY